MVGVYIPEKANRRPKPGKADLKREMSMATLCLLDENGTTVQEWDLDDEAVVVGRGAVAHVRLDDEGLSRRHFLIHWDREGYVLKDLSSRNGTWLGGTREVAARLRHGDQIVAGRSRFRFHECSAGSDTRMRLGPHGTVMLTRADVPLWSAAA